MGKRESVAQKEVNKKKKKNSEKRKACMYTPLTYCPCAFIGKAFSCAVARKKCFEIPTKVNVNFYFHKKTEKFNQNSETFLPSFVSLIKNKAEKKWLQKQITVQNVTRFLRANVF